MLNLVILLGFMGFSGATLTLPGIAGVILTIGMGVDSNVLIFERIREELRRVRLPPHAMQEGFAHAWVTISIPTSRRLFRRRSCLSSAPDR